MRMGFSMGVSTHVDLPVSVQTEQDCAKVEIVASIIPNY